MSSRTRRIPTDCFSKIGTRPYSKEKAFFPLKFINADSNGRLSRVSTTSSATGIWLCTCPHWRAISRLPSELYCRGCH